MIKDDINQKIAKLNTVHLGTRIFVEKSEVMKILEAEINERQDSNKAKRNKDQDTTGADPHKKDRPNGRQT